MMTSKLGCDDCISNNRTHTHTHRQTDRHRQSDRHRQTDRQTDTDRHRQTDTDRHRQSGRQTQTDRHRQTDTDRHRQSHTDSQTDRYRQTDTDMQSKWKLTSCWAFFTALSGICLALILFRGMMVYLLLSFPFWSSCLPVSSVSTTILYN